MKEEDKKYFKKGFIGIMLGCIVFALFLFILSTLKSYILVDKVILLSVIIMAINSIWAMIMIYEIRRSVADLKEVSNVRTNKRKSLQNKQKPIPKSKQKR